MVDMMMMMMQSYRWSSRVFVFNDDNNKYTNTDKNKKRAEFCATCPSPSVRAKRVCAFGVCVCFVMMMIVLFSLSLFLRENLDFLQFRVLKKEELQTKKRSDY